ncbi:unnamed protein product [Arctogadus glacialis]
MPEDIIEGGRYRLKPEAILVLFAWNNYILRVARPSVWQRTQRQEEDEGVVPIDASVSLRCHDYDSRPEPAFMDLAYEKIHAQQQVIIELQRRLEEFSLGQKFGLERYKTSDEDISFHEKFAIMSSAVFSYLSNGQPEAETSVL